VIQPAGCRSGRPRSATSVAAHQRVQEELEVVLVALGFGEEVLREALLPAPAPGEQAVGHVLDALVLDVVVRRALEDRHLVRRHAEDRADLVRLQLAQLEELQRGVIGGRQVVDLDAVLGEHRREAVAAAEGALEGGEPVLLLDSSLKWSGCSSHRLGRASFAKKLGA
jgi:hypothetical protein